MDTLARPLRYADEELPQLEVSVKGNLEVLETHCQHSLFKAATEPHKGGRGS
jgi:hypothetical protein